MTIESTASKIAYMGDGTSTEFVVPFLFLAEEHIRVVVRDTATGVEGELERDSQFTADRAGNASGGTVTLAAPPSAAERVTIFRSLPLVQGSDYGAASKVRLETLEMDMDRMVMMAQQLEERLERTVAYPISTTEEERGDPETFLATATQAVADALEAESGALAAQTQAESARDKAASWADQVEDVEVEAGQYSARHWAAKAEAAVGSIVMPLIQTGDADKLLQVNAGEDGFELTARLAASQVETGTGSSQIPLVSDLQLGLIPAVRPQTIIDGPLGSRPSGWGPLDCDKPTAHLTDDGSGVLRINSGLQVVAGYGGRCLVSQALAADLTHDLSSEADGRYHVHVDLDTSTGAISGSGYTDIPCEYSPERGGVDCMPAFASATLSGWGTASASGENLTNYAWKAFDRTITTLWQIAATSGALKMVFATARKLAGYALVAGADYVARNPNTWTFDYSVDTDTPDTTADTQIGQTGWSPYEQRVFMFDSPIAMKSFELDITANDGDGSYTRVWRLIPLFAGDHYDIAAHAMRDSGGAGIARVYVGAVDVVSGAIDVVSNHGRGTVWTVPVNGGSAIANNTRYIVANPLAGARGVTLQLREPNGGYVWSTMEWVMNTGGAILGCTADVGPDGSIVVQAADDYLAGGNDTIGNIFENLASSVTSILARLRVRREW